MCWQSSQFGIEGAVSVCDSITKETHSLLEERDGGMLSLSLERHLWLRLLFLLVSLLGLFFGLFSGGGGSGRGRGTFGCGTSSSISWATLSLDLLLLTLLGQVWLGVEVDVKSVGSVVLEEDLLKVCLKFFNGQSLDKSTFMFLAIEFVLVRGNFTLPISLELFSETLVLLLQVGQDSTNLNLELLLSHCLHSLAHLGKVHLESLSEMETVFAWRLDKEPCTEHASAISWS